MSFSVLRFMAMEARISEVGDAQLVHYFLNQRGMSNADEGVLHVVLGTNWLRNLGGSPGLVAQSLRSGRWTDRGSK